MAFYPDELSPIDRIRDLGKPADSLSDINAIKNRRQWKSLVLGKKDMGMNNFATITEEKEEEISSEESQSNKDSSSGLNVPLAVVPNKKITFPKPRKYITSRLTDRKDDVSKNVGNAESGSFGSTLDKDSREPGTEVKRKDVTPKAATPKPITLDAKVTKTKKSKGLLPEYVQNFAFNRTPIENQWNQVVEETYHQGWQKPPETSGAKSESKPKEEGKRRCKENPKPDSHKGSPSVRGKATTKKQTKSGKKLSTKTEEKLFKVKQNVDKDKSLNMKDMVNVYKNLTYGSKEEIKTFVENLSYVKNESEEETDKNVVSMMNLKVLESKIKNFTKKGQKGLQTGPTSEEKKPKSEKSSKRNRKAHIERLARHKVVKVPAVSKKGERSTPMGEREPKGSSKEPWKYVGMESALDKAYFVYPAYPPPSVNLKKTAKARKSASKEKAAEKPAAPKVKGPQILIRQNLFSRGGVGSALNVTASSKSMRRPSATTVCTVEFRPTYGRKPEETNQSLLVYLHGTKAINVKSPYSDRQFSRVKFFRKDEREAPLIRGFAPRSLLKNGNVSVRNVCLPDKPVSVRSNDYLNFDEDIQNITDFLRSQESPSQPPEFPEAKKRPKSLDAPDTPEAPAIRPQRRPHHHGLCTTPSLSPESIVNEISKHVKHLQYLPDTEDNRKLIAQFFDDLDREIEASKNRAVAVEKFQFPPVADTNSFRPIPILGY